MFLLWLSVWNVQMLEDKESNMKNDQKDPFITETADLAREGI